jgi:hypothetical protein
MRERNFGRMKDGGKEKLVEIQKANKLINDFKVFASVKVLNFICIIRFLFAIYS